MRDRGAAGTVTSARQAAPVRHQGVAPHDGLADEFARIAVGLADADDVPALFARIAEIGSSAIPGSDHCGVSIERRRSAVTVAGSSPVAAEVDAIQNDVGEGPGLAAMRADHLYEVADVATDPRWPRFGARIAAETPVRSLLTYRLFVADRTVGALSVFAERAHAFDRRSHEHASLLAAHAAVAVVSGLDLRNLRRALATRDLISTAKGMLMEREGVSGDEAFEMLRQASRRSNAPLRDLAARIVGSGDRRGSATGERGTPLR